MDRMPPSEGGDPSSNLGEGKLLKNKKSAEAFARAPADSKILYREEKVASDKIYHTSRKYVI